MKKPWLALTLSFLLPGAGLWYLGKFWWGVANLAIVFAIGVICALVLPEDFMERNSQLLAIGFSGGSAGLAQALATQQNAKLAGTENASTQSDAG